MMEGVTVRIEDIQAAISALLPADAIIVGHSIGNDLQALKLYHPYVIDTSVVYNMTGIRGAKTKLKTLAALFLGEAIQTAGAAGHDPTEDALASLKLAQLKLGRAMEFGDVVLAGQDVKLTTSSVLETVAVAEVKPGGAKEVVVRSSGSSFVAR
jgi:RNA exonuclease 1